MSQQVEGLRRLLRDHAGRVLALLGQDFAGQLDGPQLEEAIGEALFEAWRGSDRYTPERGTVRAWLFAIARNRARKMVARLSRESVEYVPDLDDAAAPLPEHPEEVASMAKEALAAVRAYLPLLGPRQRAVLRADLASGGQASTDDLARQMQISRNAVHQARRGARQALRSVMERHGHEVPAPNDGDGGRQ